MRASVRIKVPLLLMIDEDALLKQLTGGNHGLVITEVNIAVLAL